MEPREQHIPPPNSWEVFEDLCHQLFKAIWCDPLAQKNGRRGQAQHGVDVFGSPGGNYGTFHGVQCKAKGELHNSKLNLTELQKEIDKAEYFEPPLHHWILATTTPVDATLQKEARKISAARKQEGRFTVSVLGWGEIVTLLCIHRQVLSDFYPEHGFDVSKLLENLQTMPHAHEVRELLEVVKSMGTSAILGIRSLWHPVEFGDGRDLGPALMGRSLGPKDAATCPRLLEADAAVNELKHAYSVRIIGEPGAGKSICAYQTALHFADNGWSVHRLSDPRVETIELEAPDARQSAIFIIDDAHLTNKETLRIAEDAAGPRRLLLSTHNTEKYDISSRGTVIIDTKRAVHTLASALRNEPERTLEAVRRIDKSVGDSPFEVSLEDRIAHAEQYAQFPWQFCFIVGGGWRRAETAVTAARSTGADITLAGIAILQLASRDARPSIAEVTTLLGVADLSATEVKVALQWSIQNRLVIGPHDLRCPHQRFAIAVLTKVLEGQDNVGRERIGRLLQHIVADADYPIAGLRLLLHEFRFAGENTHQWTFLIPEASLGPLIERCWQVSTPEERMFASLLLSEIDAYVVGWPQTQLEGHEHVLGSWISDPVEPSGYGLARLIHAIYNKDKMFARSLVEASEPRALATAVSAVTSKTAYNLGEILSALHVDPDSQWGRIFFENLDRSKIIKLAADWPESESAWVFAKFCRAIPDEILALDMVENFIPTAQKLLSKDPISAFQDMRDIITFVLRMLDVLGIFAGKLAPQSRHRALARKMLQAVTPSRLAEQLSASRLREFQNTGLLLAFIAQATPAKFKATADAMDWPRIAETIGTNWKNLPHDAEVLFGIACLAETCRERIARVIRDNLHRIEAFPPRLVLIAPNEAYKHAERGGLIRLAHGSHVNWRFGIGVIACFAKERPDLLETILKPSEITTGRIFSQVHPSWYGEAADYVQLLMEVAPLSLQRILGAVDVQGAEKGWVAALRARKKFKRTVALLVESSLERSDELGVLAKRLRIRFPKSSVPDHL